MPATNKTDLCAVTAREFARLEQLLDRLPPKMRRIPDPQAEGATIKDIIGHRGAWIGLFLGWYEAGQRGETPAIPGPGYKWNDLKRFNADLRAAQADLSWQDARRLLRDNHARLCALLDRLEGSALYGGPMPGGSSPWTTGRWAEAAGPSHYRSAGKYIRARMRALGGGAA